MAMNLDCKSEWDQSLPSPDELTPLSQSLIPQELASAFNIPVSSSASTCTVTTPSSSDVLNVSQSAFESLLRMRSVLMPSVESGEAEMAVPPYQGNDKEDGLKRSMVKPLKEASDQSLDCSVQVSQAGAFAMTGAFSASVPAGHDYGSVLGHGITNGLSRLMSSSYVHIPESSGAEVSHLKALQLDEGRGGGPGHLTGESMLEAAKLMQHKVDPSEEVDSGPSVDTFQSNSVAMSNEEQSARTLKKPRLVWTPPLHKRFVDAVAQLGIKHAVPKTIMQLMSVEGLTRENVASHLQKYRLYLKRMQGLSNDGPSSSDHLFASTPVPLSLTASAHLLVSPHSQHLDHPFGPVHNTTFPSMLGNSGHHIPSHISSSLPSFPSVNTRPGFSTLGRVPHSPTLIGAEHVRESYMQQSNSQAGHILTLFPSSGS